MTTATTSSPASSPTTCASTRATSAWRSRVAAALLAAAPWAAAEGYPTADRVEYVLECMKNNGGRYDYLYKCSCAIDAIAQRLSYDDYVEAAAVARYQTMAGERMGAFRDPPAAKAAAQRYRALHQEVKKICDVPR